MIGWIYVASVSNATGFLKIGHTVQEPDEQVQEWAYDTGAPGITHVEYAAIVEDAGKVEREIHRQLSHCRERGEWFKCEIPTAVVQESQVVEAEGHVWMLGPEAFFPYCQRLLVEQLGLGVASLGELLNHQQDRLVQTYNRHAYLEQKRDALNLWSRHVMDIITPPPENILRLGVR